METYKNRIVLPADILLPKAGIDAEKWSVIACDQFTSNRQYWNDVSETVKDAPSTLKLTFPEIYLSNDNAQRITDINNSMLFYLNNGIFDEYKNTMVYVERTLNNGKIRKGIVLSVDLEQYDFSPLSKSAIRPTEGTIIERIPPRVQIRQNAALELPHIMLLADDKRHSLFAGLEPDKMQLLYNTPLMMNGGSITGRLFCENDIKTLYNNIEQLMLNDYNKNTDSKLVFAVGDGNHSLATAKAHWQQIKAKLSDVEIVNHPARYALCEVVSLYDESLDFEPIHRVVFNADYTELINTIKGTDGQTVTVLHNGKCQTVRLKNRHSLAVGSLQAGIDEYLKKNKYATVDYIHEEKTVKELADAGQIGFLMPAFNKEALFPSVNANGVLPRKTFSMGEGKDKRYYFEARKIR